VREADKSGKSVNLKPGLIKGIVMIIIIITDQHSDKRDSNTDHEYHAAGSREGLKTAFLFK
jgi:hypothetical protein